MKNILTFLIVFTSINIFNQEIILIKGKLFFPNEFYQTFSNLLVNIDGTDNFFSIKKDGLFEIKTSEIKSEYKLVFFYGNIKFKEFIYKFEWIKRKRPKSISLAEKCKFGKNSARTDFSNKEMKLFYFSEGKSVLSKKDLRFQRKNNLKYTKVKIEEIKNYECYYNYNKYILQILSIRGHKEMNKLKEETIGYNTRYSH